MSQSFRRSLRALALAVPFAAMLVGGASVAQAKVGSVHIRGVAWEFSYLNKRVGGATVRVAEYPKLSAKTEPDGRYDIVVPDKAKVTFSIVAAGYQTIYTETFTTNGEDLEHVNLQTPTVPIAGALRTILKVPAGKDGYPTQCVIVSTITTKHVRGIGFASFMGYGAHGVAGATAFASPALAPPTYFNEKVLPDTSQVLSSKDGGVAWVSVPTGVYRIGATHPTTRFASFVATCKPGRIINANPTWGLYELADDNPVTVAATWTRSAGRSTLRTLTATDLPAKATVTVRCTGKRCAAKPTTIAAQDTSLDVAAALTTKGRTLKAGQTLEVRVLAPSWNGKVVRWAIPAKKAPKAKTLCVPLGMSTPVAHCP